MNAGVVIEDHVLGVFIEKMPAPTATTILTGLVGSQAKRGALVNMIAAAHVILTNLFIG
jgi:hypothetical protein